MNQLRKRKLKSLSELKREADKYFGHYIRLRDSEFIDDTWVARCISCERPYIVYYFDGLKWRWGRQEEAGHFVGRGNLCLRYDEENVNDQCTRCNKWLTGNNAAYAAALDIKYGKGTAQKLIDKAQKTKYYKCTRQELELVIQDSKDQINFILSQQ